jgi:hypothetical protein
MAKVRNAWLEVFQDLGFSPRFVSSQKIENGLVTPPSFRVLVLPASLALSDAEVSAVRAFYGEEFGGPEGHVFACGVPGDFDRHGRLRKENPIDLEAKLAQPAHVYDVRTGKYFGRTDRVALTLDPWQPSLFALLGEPLPEGDIIGWLLRQEHRP